MNFSLYRLSYCLSESKITHFSPNAQIHIENMRLINISFCRSMNIDEKVWHRFKCSGNLYFESGIISNQYSVTFCFNPKSVVPPLQNRCKSLPSPISGTEQKRRKSEGEAKVKRMQ